MNEIIIDEKINDIENNIIEQKDDLQNEEIILENNIAENIVNVKDIENMIYEIRGKQVMLDSDLANIYKCTNGTKDINKAVKRNIERFPEVFMFQLSDYERGGRRYNPYVFTEQGIAMLSSVLHTETAINMSIKIMEAFVAMRHLVSDNLIEQKYINNMVLENK